LRGAGDLSFTVKTGLSAACRALQTPLYVRPPPSGSIRHGPGSAPSQAQSIDLAGVFVCDQSETPRPGRSWQGGRSRSLRLSVRTPPFHGGESGSIPLGSATGSSIILFFLWFSRFSPNAWVRFGKTCSLYGRSAAGLHGGRRSCDQLRACSSRPASRSCGPVQP
jgi:hypothetical protein